MLYIEFVFTEDYCFMEKFFSENPGLESKKIPHINPLRENLKYSTGKKKQNPQKFEKREAEKDDKWLPGDARGDE